MSQFHFNSMISKLLFLTMLAAVVMVAWPAQAGEAPLSSSGWIYLDELWDDPADPLDDDDAFVISSPDGRFKFSDFGFIPNPPSGPGPEAEDILVTITERAGSVEIFFSIAPPASRMLGIDAPDNWWDIELSYRAEVLHPEQEMFTGHTSRLSAFALGEGYVILQETLSDENSNSLGSLPVYDDPSGFGTKLVDSLTFALPQDIVIASKDLQVVGGSNACSGAFISGFSQTFHTELIPEPSSIALLILGCAGLGTICWRRRREP